MFKTRSFLGLTSALALLVLAIPLAHAAPALALQSRAEYDLTGHLQAEQTCTADPAEFTDRACGFFPPPPPPPPPIQVSIYDNGTCEVSLPSCGFAPNAVSAPVGSLVTWTNNGQLPHTVTSDAGSFMSPVLSPGDIFGFTGSAPGNYTYYCSIHPLMTGWVFFFSTPSPVTPGVVISPTLVRIDFDGTVDWVVEALNSEVAVLDVNHQVAVSVSPIPGLTFTPFSEEGSFEEVINLRERTVSAGTATGIVAAILEAFQRAFSGSYSPIVVSAGHDDHFTIWFVNGPLVLGSPVKVLTGTGSVTGEETVNIADIGPRSAWLVTSDFSQSFTVNSPPPGSFTSTVDAELALTWSYDKRGDLLLRSESRVDALSHTESQTTVFVDNPCAPSGGWCPIYREVNVTRETKFTIVLALQLTSTNINLDRGSRQRTTLGLLSDMIADGLWLPLSAGGVAVGATVAAGTWFARRKHRHKASPGTESPAAPTAPPPLPA